jgi:hypothetical protein
MFSISDPGADERKEQLMKRALLILAIIGLSAMGAVAQTLSPEEAKKRLEEKNAQKLEERNNLVEITLGELMDLRAKVLQLEGQVRTLQRQLEAKAGGAPKGPRLMIEIGMTKPEVLAFARSKGWRIVAMKQDAGVSRSTEKTIVSRGESTNRDVSKTTGNDDEQATPQRTRTNTKEAGVSDIEVQRVQSRGIQETIEIAQVSTYKVQTGTRRNSLGQNRPEYGTEEKVDGRIVVHLVDGLVTSVDAR